MAEVLRPLVEAARAGDRQALDSLAACVDRFVRIHSGSLSSHLRRTCGSTVDFVLEGLAEALARLSQFDYQTDEQFYAWISAYIRNRIVDAGRQAGAAKRAGRPLPLESSAADPAASDPGPSTVLSQNELRAAIGRVLLDLQVEHPREMEAVVMKLFDGRTWPAIREHFGLSSDKKARLLFARGLDLLRPHVKRSLGEAALHAFLGLETDAGE